MMNYASTISCQNRYLSLISIIFQYIKLYTSFQHSYFGQIHIYIYIYGLLQFQEYSLTYFYFLLPIRRESIVFGQIFEMEILMDLHVLRSPESEKHIFSLQSVCMCVCVSVCLCICYQHNSKTNYSRNIKFGILYLYHVQMLLETFHKDRTKTLCTGAHRRILIH